MRLLKKSLTISELRAVVKEEMEIAVEKVEKNEEAQTTLWSNLFKKEMDLNKAELVAAVEKAPTEKASPTLVAEVVQQTAQVTIDQTMKKVDSDNLERLKRSRNVVIQKVTECLSEDNDICTKHDTNFVINECGIEEGDIVEIFRVGSKKAPGSDEARSSVSEAKPRLLVVKIRTRERAEYYHNYGRGYAVDKTRDIWINEDLIKADRKAAFFARQERKQRKNGDVTAAPEEPREPVPAEDY